MKLRYIKYLGFAAMAGMIAGVIEEVDLSVSCVESEEPKKAQKRPCAPSVT